MFSKSKISPRSFWWLFYDEYMRYSNLHICIYTFLVVWLFEWIYLIEYTLNFWSYTRILFPYRLPAVLLLCFIYWTYVWGISVWRRALHGRFTRGDRKLWFKGFASFWVIEITTILGIFVAACWMSWGPLPLMPRYFLMQKKSFLFELTLFTYVVWLVYLMRMSLKWQLWKTQAMITSTIIMLLVCLLWRDLVTLYTKDVIDVTIGAKWRYVKLNSIIYSMSNVWWTDHYIGSNKSITTLFLPLNEVIQNDFSTDPLSSTINKTEYERYHWLPILLREDFDKGAFPLSRSINDYSQLNINLIDYSSVEYASDKMTLDSYKFYPRKIGFYPKKIAMWYFLVVLKIWHHIMLFIWWFFYLLRLNTKKKSSYTMLSACYFNLYCCFLICILLYIYSVLPVWENFFRVKPYIRAKLQNWHKLYEGLSYCTEIFTWQNSSKGSKNLLYGLFYSNTDSFVENFHTLFNNNNIWIIDENIIKYFGIIR